ncbi:MAG: hypothetical protein NT007_08235 [Candidatus Kapabacteria bacterium]|nr:hypothetical protein [Candidatus Kapabacteria bacterium]
MQHFYRVEANIDISDFHSGNYLILAETTIENTDIEPTKLTASDIILILQ